MDQSGLYVDPEDPDGRQAHLLPCLGLECDVLGHDRLLLGGQALQVDGQHHPAAPTVPVGGQAQGEVRQSREGLRPPPPMEDIVGPYGDDRSAHQDVPRMGTRHYLALADPPCLLRSYSARPRYRLHQLGRAGTGRRALYSMGSPVRAGLQGLVPARLGQRVVGDCRWQLPVSSSR